MTREEFLNMEDWSELIDFCYENNLYICDDVYSDSQKDDYVNDCLVGWAENSTWAELRDRLREIPDTADWYILDDYGDFCEAGDDEFEEYKESVLEKADERGLFDDDEEEYEEDSLEDYTFDEEEDEEEEFVPEMAFSAMYEQNRQKSETKPQEITFKSLF